MAIRMIWGGEGGDLQIVYLEPRPFLCGKQSWTRLATAERGRQSCAIFCWAFVTCFTGSELHSVFCKRDCCVAFRILAEHCSTSLWMKMSRWRIHDSHPRIINLATEMHNCLGFMMFSRGAGLISEICNKTIKHCHVGQPRSVVVLEETSHAKALFCFQKCVRHLLNKSSDTVWIHHRWHFVVWASQTINDEEDVSQGSVLVANEPTCFHAWWKPLTGPGTERRRQWRR